MLIFTHALQDIQFHDSFKVRGKDLGSAVTVGSGVPLNTLYQASKAQGKIFVGGTAATVVAAGGYVQGGGHSALSPTFGLAADNALGMELLNLRPIHLDYLVLHRVQGCSGEWRPFDSQCR